MQRKAASKLFATVVASLLVPSMAEAALETVVSLGIDERRPGLPLNQVFWDRQQTFSEDALLVGDSIARQSGYVTPSVSARARPGILRTSVHTESNTPGESAFESNGNAQATWTARPIIDVPGVAAGSAGTASAVMRFRGSLHYQNNGYDTDTFYNGTGSSGLNLSVAGRNGNDTFIAGYTDRIADPNSRGFRITAARTGDPVWFPVFENDPGTSESYGWDRNFAIRFEFRTGQPFAIDAFVVTNGTAAGGPGRLNWYSSGIAEWQGFTDVEVDGTAVTSFSAIDQFTQLDLGNPAPVPVPGALVLLGPALAGLMRTRRGR